MRTGRWAVVVCALLVSGVLAAGEPWPRFRGPSGQGLSAESDVPVRWTASDNVAWRTPIAGGGWSSPIVWGDRVFVTTATDGGRSCRVLALDRATGAVRWDREVFTQAPGRIEARNSHATPTPATDGQRVYATFGDGSFAALTLDGDLVWTNRTLPFHGRHGLGASLLVHDDLLITARDGSSGGADETLGWQTPWDGGYLIALNTRTGRERWRAPRRSSRIAHDTPIVVEGSSGPILVSNAGDVVQTFDPRTGRLLRSVASTGEGVVPSPVVADTLIVAASGFGAPAVRAIDPTQGTVVWEHTGGVPMQVSPIYVPPYVYLLADNGVLTAVAAATGAVAWRARLDGVFSSSPVHAGGRLYFLNEACETFVVAPGPAFTLVARNALEGRCQASMAASGGRLFIRTDTALYAIGQPAASQGPSGLDGHALLTTSIRTGDTEVFVVDATSGDAFNVTKAPASEERYPAWSPDGRRIAFTSNRGDGATFDLYVVDADGTNLRRLTHLAAGSVAYWPSWKADGTAIYVNEGTAGVVLRISLQGATPQVVAEGRDAAISPDGTRLVLTRRGSSGCGVFTMNADGTNVRQIVPDESQIGGVAPVWSADGRRIAYAGQVGEVTEIFVCDADGGNRRQVTRLGRISSSPAFSPDGRLLSFRVTDTAYWRDERARREAYTQKAADKRPVYVVETAGGEPRVVEVLHYQTGIDGSRAEWHPRPGRHRPGR